MADDEKPTETGRGRVALIAVGAFILGVITVVLFVLLRGDDRREEPISNAVEASDNALLNQAEASPPDAGIRTRPEAEQRAAAFEAAFGGRGPVTRRLDENVIAYRPAGLRWIGDRAVLVSAGRNAEECHACAGFLAVHYLEQQGDGFRVTGEWLQGGGAAGWGRPPDWSFSTDLTGRLMLRTRFGDGGQGYFCSWTKFHEFGPNGPREIADVQTGYSNTGAVDPEGGSRATEIEGEIRNIVPGRSFDIAYAGSERFTERYVMRGGSYVLSSGETRVPTC